MEVIDSMAEGPNRVALNNLALLFSVDSVIHYASLIIDTKSIHADGMRYVRDMYLKLLEDINPDAIGLVEAWGWTDSHLGSTLGHSNGKPYENLLKTAKELGQLNKFDVHPAM